MKAGIQFSTAIMVMLVAGHLTGLIGFSYPVIEDNSPLLAPHRITAITDNMITLDDGSVFEFEMTHETSSSYPDLKVGESVDLEPLGMGSDVIIHAKRKRFICGTPWAKLIRIPIIPNRIPGNRRTAVAWGSPIIRDKAS